MSEPYYAPSFDLRINGQAIPPELRAAISSVSYQTGLEGADRVELSVANQNLTWLDHPLLALDNQLELAIGYEPDPLERVFVGEIVSQEASFPSNGLPALSIAAQDRMYRLQQGSKTRWFARPLPGVGNFPIPDYPGGVLEAVSRDYGLIPIVDPQAAAVALVLSGLQYMSMQGSKSPSLQNLIRHQEGENDYQLLGRIAGDYGWDMLIDHGGPLAGYQLRFTSSMDHVVPDLTLTYGQSLTDFTPRISNVGQVVAVSVRVWQPENKTVYVVTVGWDWDREALNISITPEEQGASNVSPQQPDLAQQVEEAGTEEEAAAAQDQLQAAEQQEVAQASGIELVDEPVTLASAPRVIFSRLLPRLNERQTGSGSTMGNPRIKAGSVLLLQGLGKRFSGPYRVTSATHTIDSGGYHTSFEVRKEIWFGMLPAAMTAAKALLPGVPAGLPGR